MPGVKIDDSVGLLVQGDGGLTVNSTVSFNSTTSPVFTATPVTSIQAKTAAATITSPGVYTVSGSAILGMKMPLASAVPGGVFTFRNLSVHAHFLTASDSETNGYKVFTDGVSSGWKLALGALVNNSVTVASDGRNFCVLGASGSLNFTSP